MQRITRLYFTVVGAIGVVAGVSLLIGAGATAEFFAWPINPPLTASFMGAGYLGTGLVLLAAIVLARSWIEVRLLLPPVVVFALTMLAATALHADRFRWDRPIAWAWAGLYVVILAGAGIVAVVEQRQLAGQSGRAAVPLTLPERVALLLTGTVTALWAVPMFLAPGLAEAVWPWPLSPLTGRVVAGWIAVGGVLALSAGSAGDARAAWLPTLGWALTVGLFVATSAATSAAFAGGDLRAPIYFAALSGSVLGALLLVIRWRARLGSAS